MPEQKIGIIGVGLMGLGIASNIVKAGWPLSYLDHGSKFSRRTHDQNTQRGGPWKTEFNCWW